MIFGSATRTLAIAFTASLIAIAAQNVSAAPDAGADQSAMTVPANAIATTESTDVAKQVIRRNTAKSGSNASRATTQKSATTKTTTPAVKGFSPTRVAISLGAVVVLILLLRVGAKRIFGMTGTVRATRAVQILARSTLSPRQQLVILRVGRRLLVVADSGGQMSTLSEITDADEVAALLGQLQDDHEARATKTFGTLFGKMRGTYDEHQDEEENRTAASLASGESDDPAADPSADETRKEMSGLMDRVRSLSKQFKS